MVIQQMNVKEFIHLSWKAIKFERKTEGLNDLKLPCPICNKTMKRNRGAMNLEERLFSIIPYYCEGCEKERGDYPIYNVGWASEEKKAFWYFMYVFILLWALLYICKILRGVL